jgi:hypothetical protein
MERRIGDMLARWIVIAAPAVDPVAHPQTSRDLITIAKAMIDAAGLAGETDKAALKRCVRRALSGDLMIEIR